MAACPCGLSRPRTRQDVRADSSNVAATLVEWWCIGGGGSLAAACPRGLRPSPVTSGSEGSGSHRSFGQGRGRWFRWFWFWIRKKGPHGCLWRVLQECISPIRYLVSKQLKYIYPEQVVLLASLSSLLRQQHIITFVYFLSEWFGFGIALYYLKWIICSNEACIDTYFSYSATAVASSHRVSSSYVCVCLSIVIGCT